MRSFFISRTRDDDDDDEVGDGSSSATSLLPPPRGKSHCQRGAVVSPPRHSLFAPPREISTALRFLARHPTALNAPRTRCVSTQVDRKVEPPPPERPSPLYSAFIRRQCTMPGLLSSFLFFSSHHPLPRSLLRARIARSGRTLKPRARSVTNNFYANFSNRAQNAPDVTEEGKIRERKKEGWKEKERVAGRQDCSRDDLRWKSGTRSSSRQSRKIRAKSERGYGWENVCSAGRY